MTRSLRRLPFQSRRPRSDAGVTLVELLVALLISSVFVPLIWSTIRGSIQFFEATIWQVQLERDLDRLTTLIDAEAEDACLLGTAAGFGACDDPNPTCAEGNELHMRVTLLDDDNAPNTTPIVRYWRPDDGTDLVRNGPAILEEGRLDPDNNRVNRQLVMRNVTGFTVTPNDDCNTATITVTAVPVAPNVFTAGVGTGNAVTRTFGVRTGSRPFVD